MEPNYQVDRTSVLFSLQRAMLGEIFPALRALTVKWNENSIHLVAYIDGPISDEDSESISMIETEIMADFSESTRIDSEVIRLDVTSRLPLMEDVTWIYRRRESR